MGGFTKIHVVATEDAWADTLARAGDKLLIVEFSAVSERAAVRGVQSYFLSIKPADARLLFTQAWSAPCKAMDPYFVALSKQPEYKGIKFCRVDIDKCSVRILLRDTWRQPMSSSCTLLH